MFGYRASLFIGMFLAVFTVPLYRWFLGDFYSVFAVIGLGFIFSFIIHRRAAIGEERTRQRLRCHSRNHSRESSDMIHVDEYGRIFDPDDE